MSETLRHQVQLACLPGGKPRSRKSHSCIAGPSRRGMARSQPCWAAGQGCTHLSWLLPTVDPNRFPSQPHYWVDYYSSAMTCLLHIGIHRQGMDGGERPCPDHSNPYRMLGRQHFLILLIEVYIVIFKNSRYLYPMVLDFHLRNHLQEIQYVQRNTYNDIYCIFVDQPEKN